MLNVIEYLMRIKRGKREVMREWPRATATSIGRHITTTFIHSIQLFIDS